MATDVDICNLALAHLGDRATVTNISPPEGSAQAGHCQRFYPIARDSLLQMRNWSFATRRATPAAVAVSVAQWAYSYSLPANTLDVIVVLPPFDSADVSSLLFATEGQSIASVLDSLSNYNLQAQPYTLETQDDGTMVLYTNQPDATIMYVVRVTDTTKFSPLFVEALSHFLASKLAGPVIKGDAGRAESKGQLQLFTALFSSADTKDANQNTTNASTSYIPQSIQARR